MYNGHLSIEEIEQLSQQKGAAENQSHAENCRQCKALLEKHRTVSAKLDQLASVRIGATNGMNCPDERVWFDVAAGTLASDESLRHLQHAAECESCAQRLRTGTRILQGELSAEEEKEIAALPSASARQQKRLAEKLTAQAGHETGTTKEPFVKRKRSFWWPVSFSLAGATTVAAIVFFAWPRNSPADVEKLLAQAYTENRTIEMRIPLAKYGEIRQSRSANGSAYSNSVPFLKAAATISAQLRKQPDDSKWLLLQAERDVLDWRYSNALASIREVETSQAGSADVELLRAVALFEQAEAEQTPVIYGEAYEVLDKLLQKNPSNTVILFDHAVACEKNSMVECALHDWQLLLQLEPTGGWADEARNHLKILGEKKTSGT